MRMIYQFAWKAGLIIAALEFLAVRERLIILLKTLIQTMTIWKELKLFGLKSMRTLLSLA